MSRKEGKYVLLESTEILPECIVYEPQESRVLAFGVDAAKLSGAVSGSGALCNAASDVGYIATALTATGVVPAANAEVIATPSDYDRCTASKMEEAFKDSISQVTENGLFILAFSGSAMELKSDSKKYCISSSDFDCDNPATHVDLSQWLSLPSRNAGRPKHQLIILDCPYAAEIASQVANLKDASSDSQGFIMLAGQNGDGASLSQEMLGHSTFSYFLGHFLHEVKFTSGLIPLRKIYSKVEESCTALSLLVVTYDPTKKMLKQSIVQPTATVVTRRTVSSGVQWLLDGGAEETDQAIGRFEFLVKHYNRKRKSPKLHDKTEAWLEGVRMGDDEDPGPLVQLHRNGVLTSEVLQTVVASMVFSVASIEVAEKKETIADPNFFIFVYLCVAQTLDQVQPEAEHTVEMFRKAFRSYLMVVLENRLKDKKLQELLKSVDSERMMVAQTNGAAVV